MAEITGLLLAAGQGRRFGGNKLLAHYRHRPLVLHSAATLSACDRIIAVVRADDAALQQLLNASGIETVINPQAELGMGGSIACGVKASNSSDGWCILPADMPNVPGMMTNLIILALQNGAPLAAPYYRGTRGHPAGFQRRFKEALQTLNGERGARAIFEQHDEKIVRFDTDEPGVLEDIDTVEQLAHLDGVQHFGRNVKDAG
jgi:molybdenum cofactor cytidylyltransferase